LEKNFNQLKFIKSKFNIVRVEISLNSIWKFNTILTKILFSSPEKFLSLAEISLNEFAKLSPRCKQEDGKSSVFYKINLIGPFGQHTDSIRLLGASCLGELIYIKGFVVFYGKKKIKRNISVFFCEKNSKLYFKNGNYENLSPHVSFFENFRSSSLEIEHGLSTYFEEQKIIIYENKSKDYSSDSKSYLNIYLSKDLTGNCSVGDEVEVCGILKPFKLGNLSENFGLFETYLSAMSIKKIRYDRNSPTNKLDFLLISYFSMFSDCFERLSSLIAPQIQGIGLIKKGILLSLIYSDQKKKTSLDSLSENINLLLIGDYNVVKHEIFSFVSKIFKICSMDKYEDLLVFREYKNFQVEKNLNLDQKIERILVILKNKFAYFDNLEELSYRDKVSIGELIENGINKIEEQGTYSFDQSCPTLIGWVKPRRKSFDYTISIQENIDFPDILYNQFDLPLLLPDTMSCLTEKTEATLILNNHRFSTNSSNFFDTNRAVFSNFNETLDLKKFKHRNTSFDFQNISVNFLNNYIHYARLEVECFLSKEVVDFLITGHYSLTKSDRLYMKNEIKMIETCVKLSLAFTRCHLREFVSIQDVEYVIEFLNTVNNRKSQLKLNRYQAYTKKVACFKKTKRPIIYSPIKIEIPDKLIWPIFKLNKIITTNLVEIVWNFQKIYITSFLIKNKLKKNKFNSLIERAISIWIYRNICIIVGKDIISIR